MSLSVLEVRLWSTLCRVVELPKKNKITGAISRSSIFRNIWGLFSLLWSCAMWQKRNWKKQNKTKKIPTDECVLWDGVTNLFIYLFTFCCYWCFVFFFTFFFSFLNLHSPDAWWTANAAAAAQTDISGVCGWPFLFSPTSPLSPKMSFAFF